MGRSVRLFIWILAALTWLPYTEENVVDDETDEEPDEALLNAAAAASLRAWTQAKETKRHSHVRRRDEEVACFDGLGCFRDEGPFDYLDVLPLHPDKIGTRFLLYSRRNPTHALPVHYSNVSTIATSRAFDGLQPVKVIIHGFGSSCRRLWAREMKQALLRAEDSNVICVDWESGASLPNYVQAAANTRLVGKQVARLIGALGRLGLTEPRRIHLIGFSLGAHVAGFTGEDVANISRITGLDPAAPMFEGYGSRARLDAGDAMFVDVIHSNGDRLLKGGLGAFEEMGHVDFYPNGGKAQAGCNNFFIGAISDLFWYRSRSEEDGRSLCNHRRAYKFFTESVESDCQLRGFACDDFETFLRGECFSCGMQGELCANMGLYADETQSVGKFYLLTRDTEPLCANQFKIEVNISPGPHATYGHLEVTIFGPSEMNETTPMTGESEEIAAGKSLVKIIVAHPKLAFTGLVQLIYTAYKGWIWRGEERLFLDRVAVTDTYGRIFSFCSRGMLLENKTPLTLNLVPADCQLDTRLVWSSTPSSIENEIPIDPAGLLPGPLSNGVPFPKTFIGPNLPLSNPTLVIPEHLRFSPNILADNMPTPPLPPLPLTNYVGGPLVLYTQDGISNVLKLQKISSSDLVQTPSDQNLDPQSNFNIGNLSYHIAFPSQWDQRDWVPSSRQQVGRSMWIENSPLPRSFEHQQFFPLSKFIFPSRQNNFHSPAAQLSPKFKIIESRADFVDKDSNVVNKFYKHLQDPFEKISSETKDNISDVTSESHTGHLQSTSTSPLIDLLLKRLHVDNDAIAGGAQDHVL